MDSKTILWFLIYLLAARSVLRLLTGARRDIAFALINLLGAHVFFAPDGKTGLAVSGLYLALIGGQYLGMRLWADRGRWTPWLAFAIPISVLIVVRYVPLSAYVALGGPVPGWLAGRPDTFFAVSFVGISYLAFRSSRLVLEVRNGSARKPSFWRYLGFCFFLPTLPVGPISSFGVYDRAFRADPPAIPAGRALLRILTGAVKYSFLGNLCNQLGYANLLLDGRVHSGIELAVAAACYYLYLYLNFSGFCDMAIGAAGLMGVEVPENFDHPFAARNVKDFWNRWHITLSQYMRDVVFAPLSKFLTGLFGVANVNHAVAVAIAAVFLLVGVWHGAGWNYFWFGAMHALGVVVNHYYAIGLKKWLGRDRFKAYNASRLVRAVAIVLTFSYVAASLSLFANSIADLREIFAAIRCSP